MFKNGGSTASIPFLVILLVEKHKLVQTIKGDEVSNMKMNFKKFLLLFMILMISMNFLPLSTAKASVSVSAKSAVLIEQKSGRILYGKNAFEVRRIASITKIMTAILAIESGKIDEVVTVSNNAVRTEGSAIYLKPGEKIKLEDLLYGLMLRSGNDSAVAIAEFIGGSVDGFVYLMNKKAEEIGMSKTHFANPHGLDDHKDHFSTAYDMAILTRYAMMDPTYRKIAGTKVHRAPNPTEKWDRVWKNKNRLLTEKYKYCTGGKTGFTKLAKRTLVTTATKGDMDLIAVTINASSDWNDHIAMFEDAFKTFDINEIVSDGKISAVKDSFYKKNIYLKSAVEYPLTDKEADLVRVQYKMKKPKKSWKNSENIPDVVGSVVVYFNDEKIEYLPIYYRHPKKEKSSFFDIFGKIFTSVVGVKTDG